MSIAFETFTFLAITVVNHGNMVIAKPAGTVEGDLLIWVAHEDRNANRSFATALPAGWTLINEFSPPTRSEEGATAFKIAGPSEPATYTFQILPTQNSTSTVSAIMRFSSTIGFAAAPIGAFASQGFNVFQISPVDYPIPSANVVAAKARILRILAQFGAGNLYNDGVFSLLSGPAATEIMDKGTGNLSNRSGIAAYLEDAEVGPGATGISEIRFIPAVSTTTYRGWQWTLPLLEATFGGGGTMGGDNPAILQPGREMIERAESPPRILNPFHLPKRHCMCPIGECTCL